MRNRKLQEEDLLTRQIELTRHKLFLLNRCAQVRESIQWIKNHPDFLEAFSSEEIHEFSGTNRIIVDIVNSIDKLKEIDTATDCNDPNESNKRQENDSIIVRIDDLGKFTLRMGPKLPKPSKKEILTALIMRPDLFVIELFRSFNERMQTDTAQMMISISRVADWVRRKKLERLKKKNDDD